MSRARGILVTGTDTGVGKTLVGCALAAALSERLRVSVFKPSETGCPEIDGELQPDDALRLRRAAGSTASLDLVCPYRYAEPLAPCVAAERAGRPISSRRLHECYEALARDADVVLVESAGGLLVPLAAELSFADLAASLALEVLVVVGSRLGALNQTRLTLECAERHGLAILGYVLNELSEGTDLARETNAGALATLTAVPCLASVPFVANASALSRAELARLGRLLAERICG